MQIIRPHIYMVCSDVVFALVVGKILLSQVPSQVIHLLRDFVPHPKKSHFHCSRPLSFYSVICYTHRGRIITMYGCLRLRVPEVFGKIIPSWKFLNSAPSSALAADATTNLIIEVLT